MERINQNDLSGTVGEPLRYVFIERARCPSCDSTDLQTLRSRREDDTVHRRTACRNCGHKFFVILE